MMEVEKRVPRETIACRSNSVAEHRNRSADLRVLLAEQFEPPLRIVAIRSRSVTNQRAIWDRGCWIGLGSPFRSR